MLYWIASAWIMGFIGSTHCIGMCGPLALSLPIQSQTIVGRMFNALVYNLGRITTYALYGSLLGITHQLLVPFVFQNQLSLIMGGVMILLSVYYLFFNNRLVSLGGTNRFYQAVSSRLGKLYQHSSTRNMYLIGLLNGLLPCGLVYLALATAFASASFTKSVLFMTFFGFGTLPAMWGILFFANYITPVIRQSLRKFVPFIYAITGILLILRGMGDHNPLQQFMPSIYCSTSM
jgi:sulfite exporter TauE/SafE